MEKEYKPLSKIAGENLKRLIKETKYRTQEEFAYALTNWEVLSSG